MRLRRRPYRVTVVYRSGAIVRLRCRNFSVKHNALSGITGVEWTNPKPRPLHMGVDEVVAVYST